MVLVAASFKRKRPFIVSIVRTGEATRQQSSPRHSFTIAWNAESWQSLTRPMRIKGQCQAQHDEPTASRFVLPLSTRPHPASGIWDFQKLCPVLIGSDLTLQSKSDAWHLSIDPSLQAALYYRCHCRHECPSAPFDQVLWSYVFSGRLVTQDNTYPMGRFCWARSLVEERHDSVNTLRLKSA